MGKLARKLFGISATEASFTRRGFTSGARVVQQRLEQIGQTFVIGYDAALEINQSEHLAQQLNMVDGELRGFAFEGAAMGLMLLDLLTPWQRNRWSSFSAQHGAAHIYMMHVGAGWALARLRRGMKRGLAQLNPLLAWLAYDGYGFHEGYFHAAQSITQQRLPRRLDGYALRAFDQGLGRSLWFVNCADPARVAQTIAAFPVTRQRDLWSGVGLACAYAGGVERAEVEMLRRLTGSFQAQLAQGAAFAAKARQRAGNPASHTELACQVLSQLTAAEAAAVVDEAERLLPHDGVEPAYEIWRQRIQRELVWEVVAV
jgi:hypothetical protein